MTRQVSSSDGWRSAASGAISATAFCAGAALAWHHPSSPGLLLAAFAAWCVLLARWPQLWLFAVPAALPWLDFSPWTGWVTFSEFDLLLLASIAAGHARLAARSAGQLAQGSNRIPGPVAIAGWALVLASGIGLVRGLADAGGFVFGWFQSYPDPMNSIRLAKPVLMVVLLVPLLRAEIERSMEGAMRLLAAGMCAGLAVVAAAVVMERSAYPGLFEFSRPYRAVALFWEMHVGGAAIDGYLAMAVPFAAWAWCSARTPWQASMAALLALISAYACLTTFSRGVYGAAVLALALIVVLRWRQRSGSTLPRQEAGAMLRGALSAVGLAAAVMLALAIFGPWAAAAVGVASVVLLAVAGRRRPSDPAWRTAGGRALAAALLVEVLVVTWTGSFLVERLSQSDRDLGSRIAHWSKGLGLAHAPADRLLGIGLGRSPAHFARFVRGYEFSGAVELSPDEAEPHAVRVHGPRTQRRLAGQYGLTQRVTLHPNARHHVTFDVRVESDVDVWVGVCTMHLLYEDKCQSAVVDLRPVEQGWQRVSVALDGPALRRDSRRLPAEAVFQVSLYSEARSAQFTRFDLRAEGSGPLLRNGDFSQQLAHWLPLAQGYFLPWHLDNLYLELLVERGPLALLSFGFIAAWTLRRLVSEPDRRLTLAPFLAASIGAALLIGLVSSLLDAPRTAFLLFFLLAFAVLLCIVHSSGQARGARSGRFARQP